MSNKTTINKPDPSAWPRRLDPNARRSQLLEHAMSAFADAGIERAVHADVAARANVSTPTVFKYFPTREALVDAVLQDVESAILELPKLLPEGVTLKPAEMARTLASIISELCIDRPDLMKVALSWSVAFSSVRERYKSFESEKLDVLQALLSAAEANQSDARILFSSMLLFVRMHFDDTSAESRRNYINRLCEIFEAAPKG